MKNFYEATATRSELTIGVRLILIPIGEDIPCEVKINDEVVFNETLSSIKTIAGEVTLIDPISFAVRIQRQHPQAVKLVLAIDDKEIIPKYQHLAQPATDYLDSNDVWTLDIPSFYPWYHTITGQGWIA